MAKKTKNEQLQLLIKKTVLQEVKKLVPVMAKTIRRQLQNEMRAQINEVLADKLMTLLVEQKAAPRQVANSEPRQRSLSSVVEIEAESPTENDDLQKRKLREELRAKIIDGNPMNEMIFGDIIDGPPVNESKLPPGFVPPEGYLSENGYVDSDDEGVNLSKFGYNV